MKNTDLKKDKMTILSYLTTLRQLCLDPSIRVNGYDGGSGKIEVLKEIVHENIKGNHKILIFSQFTSMLDLLDATLTESNIPHFKLTGSTPSEERFRLVDEFNANTDINANTLDTVIFTKYFVYKSFSIYGTRDKIPATIIIDVPLPIPLPLICSPSHITSAEPAASVNVTTAPANHIAPVPLTVMIPFLSRKI